MSSFYAELRVAGRVYVIRLCEWKLTQATDARGRVIAKVRHGKVYITLDVPNDTFLEYWANAPYMPLPGCVVFFQTKGGAARETLSWEEGHCVGYGEEFEEGSSTTGSYVCHIVIAAPKLTMSPGGPPQPFVAPAPRDYAYLPVAEINMQSYTGGRGPKGLGDAMGVFSKRPYDPDSCGGPIADLNWEDVVVDAAGIATVVRHTSRFEADPANAAMIKRLQLISEDKLAASDWDKRYYTHEIREYERYRQLGIPDTEDPSYQVWNDTHTATLEDYRLADYDEKGQSSLYHPDALI